MDKLIDNVAIWRFLAENNLAVMIRPREDDWYAVLYHTSAGSSVEFKDGSAFTTITPSGKTPAEAFENMVFLYSGLVLYFPKWVSEPHKEPIYEPIKIQFPIVIKV